jgi:hypothetical protein
VPIRDQFGRHGRVRQHGADYAGIAVRKRPHCVEDMGGMRYATFNRGDGLFVRRICVAH